MKEELSRWLKGTSKLNVVTSCIALAAGLYLLGSDGNDVNHLVGFVVTVVSGLDLLKRYRQRRG